MTTKTKPVDTDVKLTTVKIIKNIYSKFKGVSFENDITLQKLVNRSLTLYLHDEGFRNNINNYTELEQSGSQF